MSRERDRAYLKAPSDSVGSLRSNRPLAVLIVTDERYELLERCLVSVAEHLPELPVYIYENSGSGYARRAELAARHPEAHWVSGPVKLGFGAAVNALVEHTPPDADLLLLTCDVALQEPLTRTRELLRRPGTATVSPMRRASGAPRPAPWDEATRRVTLIRALIAAAGYSEALRGTPLAPDHAQQPAESHTIDGCTAGVCLAINRVAWQAIGGFDEEFLGYGDEADWQARARGAGWRNLVADDLAGNCGALTISDIDATGVDVDDCSAGKRTRNRDLYRASVALLLEHQNSVHHADAYLAGTTLLDRAQRFQRRVHRTWRPGGRTDLPSIVITTNRLVYGGAERQKILLAAELSRRGYPVTVVCVQRFGPLINEVPHRVRVIRQPWWAPAVDMPGGPALLISGDTNTETGFATLWRAAGRGRRWLIAAHTPPKADRPIYSRPLAAAMRRADGFIVLAQRHWDMLTAHHRLGGRRFVAPNGVALEGEPRPKLRAVDDPLHLVMLSRIAEHKNPLLLIEALRELTDLPWTLSIFGDGPDRERLQARTPTELCDRVRWRGWAAGPEHALAKADLLCVPSRLEAFPMVILEAMARAVPVAASSICAVPEMLDFGRAGYVVEPVSVAGWRDRLARILAGPAALPEVGRRGFARMRTHYTVAAMTDAYVEAIGAVL
jgi:glycosyltransferase involved in cell wall biosynthesis/GT2 family glycosyltransferase